MIANKQDKKNVWIHSRGQHNYFTGSEGIVTGGLIDRYKQDHDLCTHIAIIYLSHDHVRLQELGEEGRFVEVKGYHRNCRTTTTTTMTTIKYRIIDLRLSCVLPSTFHRLFFSRCLGLQVTSSCSQPLTSTNNNSSSNNTTTSATSSTATTSTTEQQHQQKYGNGDRNLQFSPFR